MIAWSKVLYFIQREISSFFCICTPQHTPVYKEMASARPKNRKAKMMQRMILVWKQNYGWRRHDGAQSSPSCSACGRWVTQTSPKLLPSVILVPDSSCSYAYVRAPSVSSGPDRGSRCPADGSRGAQRQGRIHSFMFNGKAESLFLRPCRILCAYQLLPVPVASIVPFACYLPKQELQTSSKHLLFYQE